MVICIGVGLTLLGLWVPWPGLWAVLGLFFLCPGCGLVVLVLFAYPGLWGLLGCFVGCARMWVLGFVVQFCLVVCVGCTRMWVIGLCLSGVFLYRADAPFPLF